MQTVGIGVNHRHLQVLYCDDIRNEIGGKLSFMGIYTTSLIVKEFPVSLPKFCISMRIVTPIIDPFEFVKIRILKDDTDLQEFELPESAIAEANAARPKNPTGEEAEMIQIFNAITVIAPMQFDGPCAIRVRADTESGEIRGQGIKIERGAVAS